MIQIRKAGLEDIALINALGRSSFFPTYTPFISEAQVSYMFEMMYAPAALENQISEKGHIFLIAAEEGENKGFVSFELNHDNKKECKIHKLYILPDKQGKGIGKALLGGVVQYALQAEQEAITLNVNRYNKALHFYERNAFCIDGEEDIDIGGGYYMNDYRMRKDLRLHPGDN